jgi:ABC-2 type transport system permease protein
MMRWWSCYVTATRFALIEQARNRLALVIVLLFIPLWICLAHAVADATPVPFFVRPAGRSVTVHANTLATITGALQAIALIVGFMMFIATARSAPFDRRLVQAGYPRLSLVLAKVSSLVLAAAAVAVYTTAWMQLYWRPQELVLLAASLFLGALIYGGIGIMLAAVLRGELAGMFLLIMVSFVDLGLQNPIATPVAASPVVRALPAYGAMQCAITSVGLRLVPWSYLALGLCWAVGTAAIGITAFVLRTRSRRTSSTIDAADPVAADDAVGVAVLADPASTTKEKRNGVRDFRRA